MTDKDRLDAAGGPAHPTFTSPGMTLTDHFAAAALMGYVAGYAGMGTLPYPADAAASAYEYARAMCRERMKPQPQESAP